MAETNVEVLQRLMHQGGYILVCGGEMHNLPDRYHQHPQILVWDDNDQSFANKKIPTNTRGIVYNRWISHSNAGKLRKAATQLGIPVFPLLRKREVLEVLDSIISEPVVRESAGEPYVEDEREYPGKHQYQNESEIEHTQESIDMPQVEEVETKGYLTSEEMMRKPKIGELRNVILPKEYQAGSNTPVEAKRIVTILKDKYGIKMTWQAVAQQIYVYQKAGTTNRTFAAAPRTEKQAEKKAVASADDFAEGERLLRDARAAIDLFLNFLPKLRKTQEELTAKQRKIRELLGD